MIVYQSDFCFVDHEALLFEFGLVLLIVTLVQFLQVDSAPALKLHFAELDFLVDFLSLFDDIAGAFVLDLGLVPVCGPGDALQLFGVLFGLSVFLVNFNSLVDGLHKLQL